MSCGKHSIESGRQYYFRQIQALIPLSRKKRQIVEQFKQTVLGESPDDSYEQLLMRYGKPEEVAASYLSGWSPEDLIMALHLRQRRWRIVIASLLAAVVLAGMFLGYISWYAFTHPTGYVIISPAYVDEHPGMYEDEPPLDPDNVKALIEEAGQNDQIPYIDANS